MATGDLEGGAAADGLSTVAADADELLDEEQPETDRAEGAAAPDPGDDGAPAG